MAKKVAIIGAVQTKYEESKASLHNNELVFEVVEGIFEETGLTLTKSLQQSPAIFSSSGLTDESISLLFVECEGMPTNSFNESSEDIEVIMLSRDQASDILSNPLIKFDVKSWIVLNTFVCQGVI